MKHIEIHQWNVLADRFADRFGFPYATDQALEWEHRKKLFKEILGNPTDDGIYVFEEVEWDMLQFFLEEIFTEHTFQWISKNSTDGKMRDGTVIFSPHSAIEKIDIPLGTQNALILRFDNNIWVCAVHLKAKEEGDAIRPQQIRKVLTFLDDLENVILIGDFNDVPESETIKLVQNAKFKSAYPNFEPTTAKKRNKVIVRCIDYIWYRGPAFAGVIETSKLSEDPPMLPNEEWPSDHLKLYAKIKLN